MVTTWSPAPSITTDVFIVDAATVSYASTLRDKYDVSVVSTVDAALEHLRRSAPSVIVSELELDGRSAVEVCRQAKLLPLPSTVLVTTGNVELVPEALDAGCDGVLLKPFQPNLLHARIARLVRARSAALRLRAQRLHAKSEHLRDRSELLVCGTNRHWPATYCPYCAHQGVTGFEFASYRQAWYACVSCKKVWLAKRQE